MREGEPQQPQEPQKLRPNLKVYEGGYSKVPEKEFDEKVKATKERERFAGAKKKVEAAVEKGEVTFGDEQEQEGPEEKPKKPSFDEWRTKERTEQDAAIEEASRNRKQAA